MGNLLKT